MKKIAVAIVGVISFIYLLNFTAGGLIPLELPDALPFIGNMDEAAAAALFLSALRYFGMDFSNIFGKDETVKVSEKETKIEILDSYLNKR
jgi:hypothetical protein